MVEGGGVEAYVSKSFLDFSDHGSFSEGTFEDMAAGVVFRVLAEGVVSRRQKSRSTEAEAGIWGVALCKHIDAPGVPGAPLPMPRRLELGSWRAGMVMGVSDRAPDRRYGSGGAQSVEYPL